jgi:hypothetical protein
MMRAFPWRINRFGASLNVDGTRLIGKNGPVGATSDAKKMRRNRLQANFRLEAFPTDFQ